ncbi:MAG: tRNA (adenosine(37)-N6)-threonylcarbamoyltransferase complex dimerization subunit type 1 TsaB [Candidatus Promineifilaceae bacterium]
MILAVDTATRWTGIALHDGNHIIAELGWHAVNTQTVELAPTVVDLLRKTNVAASSLTGLAVTIGPGSYTGLRVGMGFAKGIALAHAVPLVGIGTLDVIVSAFEKLDGPLVPVCAAGRKRICAATYRYYSRKAWQVKVEPDIYTWDELLAQVPAGSTIVGEISAETRRQIKQSDKNLSVASSANNVRRAAQLAELAAQRIRKRDYDDAASLVPIYLREPGGGKRIVNKAA